MTAKPITKFGKKLINISEYESEPRPNQPGGKMELNNEIKINIAAIKIVAILAHCFLNNKPIAAAMPKIKNEVKTLVNGNK